MSFPLIRSIFFNTQILKVNALGKLEQKTNLLDGGLQFCLNRSFTNRFGIGIEFNRSYQEVQAFLDTDGLFQDASGQIISDQIVARYENLDYISNSIILKLIFSSRRNLAPIGISHEMGVAFTSIKLVDKSYVSEYSLTSFQDQNYTLLSIPSIHELIDFKKKTIGASAIYTLKFTTPLNKRTFIYYGTRLNINFTRSTVEDSLGRRVQSNRYGSLIYFHLGSSISF